MQQLLSQQVSQQQIQALLRHQAMGVQQQVCDHMTYFSMFSQKPAHVIKFKYAPGRIL